MSILVIDRERGNMGGINAFSFIFESQLGAPIEIIKGQATTLIANVSNFITPDIIKESSTFQEEKLDVNRFSYVFTTRVAKDDYSKIQDCDLFDSNRVIALVKDNNNQVRLLGQYKNACELVIRFNKGSIPQELNHYIIEIKWISKQRAAIVPEIYIEPTQIELEDNQFLELEY